MASINGWVFVIIGAIMFGVSTYQAQLAFFTYVSIAVIVYGLIKVFVSWVSKRSNGASHTKTEHYSVLKKATPGSHAHTLCLHCSKHIHVTFLYCPYCGHKVSK
jgi:NhaP-type Na+/H+ or K+/H+ antiporter